MLNIGWVVYGIILQMVSFKILEAVLRLYDGYYNCVYRHN